ncbi:hypothetical protein AKJ51_02190 [candidate division MSBL1 archaeon SCGC-AAA382A20]|uniref:AAA+ ATPase domain-containing protein n=1 Tax=candidate division MSBL1 archaeon SCGC-AAA382A20 TaxID=1698280 RepID=A0A133VKU5_9EURY|nr:hypothetical protein AKJ51_02190 [candidate division MSBL1 archaeon SCGC-AAA382A20]
MIQKKSGKDHVILGCSKKENLNDDWCLYIGNASNKDNRRVELDCVSPHVIFVCGARGSGKSYTLGVIAEEIAQSEIDIASVIVDPVGIFWSMKYPNQEKGEKEILKKTGNKPRGINNVEVFVPRGYSSKIPEETFDTDFSFKPSSLVPEDWCLTFGIDRYSPQGLLLERAIEKVRSGYTRKMGDKVEGGSRDVPPNDNFSIDDLLECINHDRELLSKKKGFKSSTRRALSSRLTTARDWGIFGREKKLSDLIKPGMISVIDISFLPENIGALVLGLLSRKIFSARKSAAREEAIKDLKNEENQRTETIPPTWLMVDEAHSFAPSSGKTAATDPLVEFVKQGRRPGLSAVLSTQQPSALNSKIISQLDILLSHRLSFENDIKEVWKRMPTSISDDIRDSNTLKKLPRGTAVAGDRQVDKAFYVSVRPRVSQHEGRERVTNSNVEEDESQQGAEEFEEYEEFETRKDQEKDEEIRADKGIGKEVELSIIPFQIDIRKAAEIAKSYREKLFGLFWAFEEVKRVFKRFYPILTFLIDYYPKSGDSINLEVHFDGLTGELLKKRDGELSRTKGVRNLINLSHSERGTLFEILKKNPVRIQDLKSKIDKKESTVDRHISKLTSEGIIRRFEKEGNKFLDTSDTVDIPSTLSKESLLVAEGLPKSVKMKIPPVKKEDKILDGEKALRTLEFFGDIEVIQREIVYYPYWIAELVKDREKRIVVIDGVNGNRDNCAERMLRRRVK